ncbi:uncharacterized protein NPIL_210031 [Nephila pilipes]|uniref:Uncharacterized protein n=1 Tax=Nephila pilipes TaxID=299642 RepID=A0A8X6U1V3_NEPPI|nr:uncharacterized protein NPIL_210031 [Nephila pilipes]
MGGSFNKEPPRDVKPAFDKYVELNGVNGLLPATRFKNWLTEAFILGQDTEVTPVDIENVLSSNNIDRNGMNFDDFKKCVKDLAKGKKKRETRMINSLVSAAEANCGCSTCKGHP